MLLFAALMLADELHDLHRQMPPPGEDAPAEPAAEVIARIELLAARVEKLAAHLDEPAT
jgi:cell division protein ZapA